MDFSKFPRSEIDRRFSRTFVYHTGRDEVVQIRGFSDNQIVYRTVDSGEEIVSAFNIEEWCLNYPKLGFINWRDHAIYMSRVPVRQYKYGYRGDSIMATTVGDIWGKLGTGLGIPSFENTALLQIIFDRDISRRYKTLREAFNLLKSKKKTAISLNEKWALSVHMLSEHPVLIHGPTNLSLGVVPRENRIQLHSEASFLYEELINQFNNTEIRLT